MFMNDVNESKDNKSVISPLAHDYEGRFSRKGKVVPKVIYNPLWLDALLSVLFMSFLLISDFILFAGSGNIKVFDSGILPRTEILIIISGLLLFSIGIIWLLINRKKLKNIVLSLFVLFFVYIIYQQFSQYYYRINIGIYIVPVYLLLGIIFAVVTYVLFENEKPIYKILYVVAAGVVFGHIYISYMSDNDPYDFIESYNTQHSSDNGNKKFVYLMLPNFAAYSYISTFQTSEADNTKHILQGFWQKNNFRVYNRAYTSEINYFYNMALALNPTAQIQADKHILKNKRITEYWRFHNLRNEFIYLKNNELYDIFRKNNFQISAYKSRDFDMCRKNHLFNVNRCVEKINRPVNLYDMNNVSLLSKSGILLIDWLSSIKLFNPLLSTIYNFLHPIVNVDKMPMVGTNYNNLYVVNSIKTFDILLDNIKKDEGKQAYFVFVDIPSDMYVYDEYCRIRPQNQWLNRTNLPWIKQDYTYHRRDAYLQQTKCLIGKMEYFIEQLQNENIWKDTVLVVIGTSGLNNFQNEQIADIAEDFMANRLVSMAIYDSDMNVSENNEQFCSIEDFVAGYLYGHNKCNNDKLDIHTNTVNEINRRIGYLSKDINDNYIPVFEKWYQSWREADKESSENYENNLIKLKSGNGNTETANDNDISINQYHEEFELNNQVFSE